MKNKSDKYLDLAKEVRLAHVPNKGKEAESLLNSTKSGTAQNIFTRIFNYFGRHLIMTITSLIALIVAGLLMTNSEQLKEQPVESKMVNNTKPVERKIDKEDLVFSEAEREEEKKDNDKNAILKDTTIVKETHYTLDDLRWDLIKFDHENWNFQYVILNRTERKYDKNGDSSYHIQKVFDDFDNKYLIQIEKELEDSIKVFFDINRIKDICNLEIDEYFFELSKIGDEIKNYKNSIKTVQMINLYAHINRKFLNNPSEEMKIKSKGIVLPKETLESLGITFSDSTVAIPQDDYYMPSIYRNKIIDWYDSEKISSKALPDNDIILKKNIIYEWTTDVSKHDSTGKINWYKTYLPANKRINNIKEYFKTNLTLIDDLTNSIMLQSYYYLQGILPTDTKSRLCPLILEDLSTLEYHDLALWETNNESRRIYNYYDEINKEWRKIRNDTSGISDTKYIEAKEKYDKQKAIFDNMLASYKYRYLIPVDIHLPYYNLTKEELDSLDFYQSITLWYYPSEEFLSKLPEDIRVQLEKEIKLVEEVQKGELQPEEACAEVGDKESLLGLCNLSKQTLTDLKVFPNPAQDIVNIEFYLLEPVQYKIILTDMTGNYIQDITDWRQGDEGIEQWFLTDRENGTYLVQVITEKGEKLMAKFIIRK